MQCGCFEDSLDAYSRGGFGGVWGAAGGKISSKNHDFLVFFLVFFSMFFWQTRKIQKQNQAKVKDCSWILQGAGGLGARSLRKWSTRGGSQNEVLKV